MKAAPLFHPRIIQQAMDRFVFPPDMVQKHAIIKKWIAALKAGTLDEITEVSLHGDFLKDIFENVLGYPGVIAGEGMQWNLHAEKTTSTGGGTADGAIGFFRKGGQGRIVTPIELKGARIELDREQTRGYSPVQQGWRYANETPDCHWVIVSNYRETRLYHTYKTPAYYESFWLTDLAEPLVFSRFYFLLCKENFLSETSSSLIERLLAESGIAELEVTNRLYEEYKGIRETLFDYLRRSNPMVDETLLLSKAQKILDRILFICFCEDRGLLPPRIIEETYNRVIPGLSKWTAFKLLFAAIDKGHPPTNIPGYNGGLFASDSDLDRLELPDEACDVFQHLNRYDFESEISVNILGHIFEQSVADLEAMLAVLRGETPSELSRRKTEGVYYTPSHVTRFIVKETLSKYLQEQFHRILKQYQPDKVRGRKKQVLSWLKIWETYRDILERIRVLDPACGSGAFLVAAFDELLEEHIRVNQEIAKLKPGGPSQISFFDLNKKILNNNLYGLDINEESVEITKLSLWIKTAERGKPLTDLDHTIQCGNSLVDAPDIDRRAFVWQARFPEVFKDGGFDVVIGNPPYIKLQNFRNSHSKEAAWLVERYESARTGNFDLYLPFIERGLELLHPRGRLGFIAPSVWLLSEYGKGLRILLLKQKAMDRFVDFKSFQVFEDATTYTALQFFSREPVDAVQYAVAPDGDLMLLQWAENSYNRLDEGPWVLLPQDEQELLLRLRETCLPLNEIAERIIVGIQTSADSVYHLERVGPGRYFSKALGKVVEIEDAIMRPLVSGAEARRYTRPITSTYLLFPYDLSGVESGPDRRTRLWTADEIKYFFPKAWSYLETQETLLRRRERGRFNLDNGWWQFGRNQNLDKQYRPKLGVAETVPFLRLFCDPDGQYYFNNVRVNGILVEKDEPMLLWYLLGILNAPVANFVFTHIAKPKNNGYFEANKQFIAPLPIPRFKPKEQVEIAKRAQDLSRLYTVLEKFKHGVLHRIIMDLGNGRASRNLERWYELDLGELRQEVRQRFKRDIALKERDSWEQYLETNKEKLGSIASQIERAERDINKQVFELYRLSEKEIRLVMENTPIIKYPWL